MNKQPHESLKAPIVLDTRSSRIDDKAVQMVIDVEEAQKLQDVARQLGGFSVGIIASAGDPYKIIYESEMSGRVITSTTEQLGEGMVIINVLNTGNPSMPTDLSLLWQATNATR